MATGLFFGLACGSGPTAWGPASSCLCSKGNWCTIRFILGGESSQHLSRLSSQSSLPSSFLLCAANSGARACRYIYIYRAVPQPSRFSKAGDLLSSPSAVVSRASMTQFSEDSPYPFAKNAKGWGTLRCGGGSKLSLLRMGHPSGPAPGPVSRTYFGTIPIRF